MFRMVEVLTALSLTAIAFAAASEEPLVIAMGNDTRPYYYVNADGAPEGWLVDLWQLWSATTGTPIVFKPGTFAQSLGDVRDNKADAHIGCFQSVERDEYLDFGVDLCEVSTHLFYDRSMTGIRTLADLRGFIVGAIEGDRALDYIAQNAPNLELRVFANNVDMFDAIERGDIRAFVKDTAVGLSFLKERGLLYRFEFPVGLPLYSEPFRVAVHQGNAPLLDRINSGMAAIAATERAALELKWMGTSGTEGDDVLRVALVTGFPPYSDFGHDGRPIGLFVDLAQRIAQEMHRRVEFYPGSRQETIDHLLQDQADVGMALVPASGMPDLLSFSRPVTSYRLFSFFSLSNETPSSISDLAGRPVGVIAGHAGEQLIAGKYPELNVKTYTDSQQMVLACAQGSLAAMIGDGAHIAENLHRLGIPGAVRRGDTAIAEGTFALAMHPDDAALLQEINDAIGAIPESELAMIQVRWIPDPALRAATAARAAFLSAGELGWMQSHPSIRIGVTKAWPPISFAGADNALDGIDGDILKLVTTRTGLRVELVFGSARSNRLMLAAKRLDAIMDTPPEAAEALPLLYTEPYAQIPLVIVGRSDGPYYDAEAQLAGQTVAVETGSAAAEHFREHFPTVKLLEVSGAREALQAVARGEAEAFAGNRAVANYVLAHEMLNNLQIMGNLGRPGIALAFAVREDWPELQEILNKTLATITLAETQEILNTWAGENLRRNKINLTAEEVRFVQTHAPLVFSEVDWKPLSIVDNPDEYQGIIADYLNEITKRSGLEFSFTPHETWANVLKAYDEGRLEVVPAIASSSELNRPILLTKPFTRFPLVIVAPDDVSYIQNTADLAGLQVAVGRGYTSYHFLKDNYPNLNLIQVDDVREGLIMVSEGTADVFVGHLAVAVDHMRQLGLTNLKIAGQTEFEFEHCIGIDPAYPEAVSIINKVLDSMTEEDRRAIAKKWLDVEIAPRLDYTLIWRTVAIALTVVLAIAIWNRKLAGLNTALNNEVRERKEAEAARHVAQQEAESANRAKSEFLAMMSHEIRTPMNAIIGMAHLALRTDLSQKQYDYVSKMESAAKALLGIINDILDFSKIEAGRLELEKAPFELEEVLDHLGMVLTARAVDREDLEILFDTAEDVPRRLIGDSLRLGQVLINLGGNAIKFTTAGQIVVRVRVVERAPDSVKLQFQVEDTGIGMTDAQVAGLFRPFTQADSSTTRRFGGTGLGLSISKRIVELMGGAIEATSRKGQGSTFAFTARFSLPTTGAASQAPVAGLEHMRALVVDDNAAAREILKNMLATFGVQVETAASAEEGIAMYRRELKQPYALILMDWRLPGMSGIDAVRHIRAQLPGGSDPAIFLVTAYGRDEVIQAARDAHIDTVLLKPISPSLLLDAIAMAFGQDSVRRPRKPAPAAQESPLAGLHVLLVEDNQINQQVAVELLSSAGAHVSIASNGQEAVQAADPAVHHIVLMDIQMPVMDGFEATAKIRESISHEALPIIAMTANAMASDRERSLEAGMCDHIAKPIDPDVMLETVLKWARPAPPEAQAAAFLPAARPEAPAIPPLKDIEIADGLRRVAGNRGLYIRLLHDFRSHHCDAAEEIRQCIAQGNSETAIRRAHSLRGVAGNLGIPRAAQAAAAAEAALKSPRASAAEAIDALEQILRETHETLATLRALEERPISPDAKPLSAEEMRRLLAEIQELLNEDLAAAIDAAASLRRALAATALRPRANELVERLDAFDVDGARESLIALSHELEESAS